MTRHGTLAEWAEDFAAFVCFGFLLVVLYVGIYVIGG